MKASLLGLLLVVGATQGMAALDETLSATNVLVVSPSTAEQSVWIPYVGNLSGVCGFEVLPSSAYAVDAVDLVEALVVTKMDGPGLKLEVGKKGVAEITLAKSTDPQSYGVFAKLKTASGESFDSVMHKLISNHTSAPDAYAHGLVLGAKLCKTAHN